MCPRVIFGHFFSQGTRYAITTEASFHGASTLLRVFRGVFRSFSRGLNHPETCAGVFIRSALVLFALLPLHEPGASLTSTEGTSKTVSSVSERSQPSCLAASHSSRQVGFPFIILHAVYYHCVTVFGSVEGPAESAGPSSARRQRGRQRCGFHVTCTSMSSSNFVSAAVFDIYQTASVLLIDCILVHKIHVSPAPTFTADVCY